MRIIIILVLLILSFSTVTFAEERKMTFVEKMEAKKAERKAKREKAEKNPFLIDVRSKEYTTTLSEKEILSKAKICFAQFGDRSITESNSIIVAKTVSSVSDGFLLPPSDVRTTLTLKAYGNKFKMRHTNIEKYNSYSNGFIRVCMTFGCKYENTILSLERSLVGISSCIINDDDW